MLWTLLTVSLIGSAQSGRTQSEDRRLNGTTSQSTNYLSYTADRAIDGDLEKCAHTLDRNNSWWTIDLLGVYRISNITIYNTEQLNTDMSGAQIHIGFSRRKNGTDNPLQKTIQNFKKNHFNNYVFNTTVLGRYITVFLPNQAKHLILCEVMIFGTRKESRFKLVKEKMRWDEALYYCRDRDMDLASIVGEETQVWADLEARKAETPFVWLGLRYTCTLNFWFWVDDQRLTFNHWAPDSKTEECDMSVAMEKQKDHFWYSKPDNEMFNFICAK
ncbi:fucolectin-1 [Etheostoma spectabile]|uniref:C-type lectin domain-containing protein n=1 Tax=Etheostoma spectabile TaxID=54343 RepID=A0A5J5DCF8_9PERO|nr:fucolectin-1-like [Etheostoma spectabile]XP_032374440.1 fucolectin-1-like [Etheostoma spectabile]KAA8591509.1 hypothetical protein FQN60_016883 [Etheostoma spectabile]